MTPQRQAHAQQGVQIRWFLPRKRFEVISEGLNLRHLTHDVMDSARGVVIKEPEGFLTWGRPPWEKVKGPGTLVAKARYSSLADLRTPAPSELIELVVQKRNSQLGDAVGTSATPTHEFALAQSTAINPIDDDSGTTEPGSDRVGGSRRASSF